MRLKLFRAATMAEAMRLVRREMGPDALMLSSRRVAEGVEITAGLDAAAQALPTPEPAPEPPPEPKPTPPAHDETLAWHGASPTLRRRLRAGPLPFALAAALRFGPLPLAAGGAPVLLAGPPGAGKTLTAARLATRLVMAGTKPLIVTADGQRAGAAEQLAAFTRVLGLDLLVASRPAALRQALARRAEGAPMLVDAPGTDALNPSDRAAIAELAGEIGAAIALVIPAGADPGEAAETAAALAESGARLLVATRLDVSRRLGSVLAAAEAGLALAEAGIGPGAADGLVPFTPALLAARLLRQPIPLPEPVA
jgi:flagellar biosynthesis protein FlhF